MRPDASSDLSWLALRYICGELSDAETAAFELRLDEDQAAREAVARAVELAGAVVSLPRDASQILPAPRRPLVATVPRWILAIAASALFLIALRSVWHDRSHPTAKPAAPSAALALAWSGVHEDEDKTADLLEWLDAAPQGVETHLAAVDTATVSDSDVPDWMLEAGSLTGSAGLSERKEN